ncbi:hypothetical protein [Streptomyces sp. NPDC012888]|uniref:hypothetical protein n=1 Tax=Streptomyces sp. NPDC012888 TaxID=3364855 RepID=UPI0036B95B32
MTSGQSDTSPTTPTTPPATARRRRPSLVVGAVAAAVLVAGGGTAYWASAAGGDSGADGPRTAAAAAREATPPPGPTPPPGIAPGEPDPTGGGVVYEAAGVLPEGPAAAPSFKAAGEVTAAEVARLAAALGIEGEPVLSGAVWAAGHGGDSPGPRLTVTRQAPGTWTYSAQRPAGGDDCVRGKDTCGPATLPEAPGEPVSEAAAKAAAAPVLAAVGQSTAKPDARLTQGGVRVVTADPVVGGLPTLGWSTKVSVGADGGVVAGSGELKAPERTGERPVVGAKEALARLNEASRGWRDTGPSGCATPVPHDGGDTPTGTDTVPCNPEPRPIKPPRTETVKGAVLGLTAATVDGVRGLAPAWLFEVAGKGGGPGHTVAQPALAEDRAPKDPEVPGSRTVPGFSYGESDRKLTVHFWGGVCSTYALEVREHAASVSVRITDTPREPGRACILIAQEMSVSATLEQPLGGRKVIDASTGKDLPRT